MAEEFENPGGPTGSPTPDPTRPAGLPGAGNAPGASPNESLVTTARGADSWLTPEFLAAIDKPRTPGMPAAAAGPVKPPATPATAGFTSRPLTPRPSVVAPTPPPAGPDHKPMTRGDIDALLAKWITPPSTPAAPAAPAAPAPAAPSAPSKPPALPPITRPMPVAPTAPVAPAKPSVPAISDLDQFLSLSSGYETPEEITAVSPVEPLEFTVEEPVALITPGLAAPAEVQAPFGTDLAIEAPAPAAPTEDVIDLDVAEPAGAEARAAEKARAEEARLAAAADKEAAKAADKAKAEEARLAAAADKEAARAKAAEERAAAAASKEAARAKAAEERAAAAAERQAAKAKAAEERAAAKATAVAPAEPAEGLPFTHSVGRTIASAVLPGTGLLGRRSLTSMVIGLAALVVIGGSVIAALIGVSSSSRLLSAFIHPGTMRFLGVAAIVLALAWVAVIAYTFLTTHPRPLTKNQRVGGGVLVAVLSLLVVIPMATGAGYAFTAAGFVSNVFATSNRSTTVPTTDALNQRFADGGRVNLLLIGATPVADGNGAITTDTLIVASIDIKTGTTVLIQMPSNVARMPFPPNSGLANAYQQGFYDGTNPRNANYFVSAIWSQVPKAHPELFTDTDQPGADALKQAVGTALGLTIDYYAMFDVSGIQKLVDTLGGVTVNVNFPLAKTDAVETCGSGPFVSQGASQKLDGTDAYWYAHSQCNDPNGDYGRMDRQKCLVNALATQTGTAKLVTKFPGLASAMKGMTSTDIPRAALGPLTNLLKTVKADGSVTRLSFVHGKNGFNYTNPNFALMKVQVTAAIRDSATPSATTATDPNGLATICAYNPQS